VSNCSTPLPRREGEGIGKTVTLLLQTWCEEWARRG
jgi:hypothetical protein